MIFSFPSHHTESEKRLLQKFAQVKEKKKAYLEAKAIREQKSASKVALKRASIDAPNTSDDAKETAKKLIKSGAIKLEAESKEKGFKRSLSRKDDHFNRKLSDIRSPLASTSSASSSYSPSNVHSPSPVVNPIKFQFPRQYSIQNSSSTRFTTPTPTPQSNSLFVRGDREITEDFLRNVFTKNITDISITSIDMKKNSYAFISVDSIQSAETAIKTLHDQVFNEVKLSVSYARPRQPSFNRRPFIHHPTSDSDTSLNWNESGQTGAAATAAYSTTGLKTPSRNVISYDDNSDLFSS